jgi:hypothetical protein
VNYFTVNDVSALRPKLITAFEVFEHLPDPGASIGKLLRVGADVVLFTTGFLGSMPRFGPYEDRLN